MPVGQVIRAHSNQFYVLIDDREWLCRPRGKFRLDRQDVLAGDMVQVHLEGEEGRIDEVLPRRSVMQRPAVANVDQAIVVFTLREPQADLPFLDRVLVHAERAGIQATIVLNKVDLLSETEVEQFCETYGQKVGYVVIPTSATLGMGLDDLRPLLPGQTSVLAGHSGVGKSRLVQALHPQRQDIRVGDLSSRLGKGKHTTRHVELIPLPDGGLIADAPGFTYLEFEGFEKGELPGLFPEFRPLATSCRFYDCMHRREPDCAVRAGLEEGAVAHSRYENYLLFLSEIEALKRW